MHMQLEDARVLKHDQIQGGYRLLVMRAPGVTPRVRPGQFVHLSMPCGPDLTLRRPFSVYKAEGDTLSILYKDVGKGTHAMTFLRPDEEVSIIGPLGRGFPSCTEGRFPVLVAGGYGMAPLYLVASSTPQKGLAFFGGAGSQDILCVEEFEALGWEVRVATEDGSLGARGLVTDPLDAWLAEEKGDREPELFACGPTGMLEAVGRRAEKGGWKAWLSMDRHMGCGVGACLTCVQKTRQPAGGWTWSRVCKEGPVFECREIVWEEKENG